MNIMRHWYIGGAQQPDGPYTASEMLSRLGAGQLASDAWVCRYGQQWVPAASCEATWRQEVAGAMAVSAPSQNASAPDLVALAGLGPGLQPGEVKRLDMRAANSNVLTIAYVVLLVLGVCTLVICLAMTAWVGAIGGLAATAGGVVCRRKLNSANAQGQCFLELDAQGLSVYPEATRVLWTEVANVTWGLKFSDQVSATERQKAAMAAAFAEALTGEGWAVEISLRDGRARSFRGDEFLDPRDAKATLENLLHPARLGFRAP